MSSYMPEKTRMLTGTVLKKGRKYLTVELQNGNPKYPARITMNDELKKLQPGDVLTDFPAVGVLKVNSYIGSSYVDYYDPVTIEDQIKECFSQIENTYKHKENISKDAVQFLLDHKELAQDQITQVAKWQSELKQKKRSSRKRATEKEQQRIQEEKWEAERKQRAENKAKLKELLKENVLNQGYDLFFLTDHAKKLMRVNPYFEYDGSLYENIRQRIMEIDFKDYYCIAKRLSETDKESLVSFDPVQLKADDGIKEHLEPAKDYKPPFLLTETINAIDADEFLESKEWWGSQGQHRIYIHGTQRYFVDKYAIECTYYNTGNLHSSEMNGEKISNSKMNKILGRLGSANVYLDCIDGKLHIESILTKEEEKELLARIKQLIVFPV